jgi:hypothetical protein
MVILKGGYKIEVHVTTKTINLKKKERYHPFEK